MNKIHGTQKWAILLCQFKDSPLQVIHNEQYFINMFETSGTGGIQDYWKQVSHGKININDSRVFGWKTISKTENELFPLNRYEKLHTFASEFEDEVYFPDYIGIVVIINNAAAFDAGSVGIADFKLNKLTKKYGTALVARDVINNTFIAHEMGHGFGLLDSFDNSSKTLPGCEWCPPGAYLDPWDIMSAMNVHTFNHSDFGSSGPILNAQNMKAIGWLDDSRIWNQLENRLNSWKQSCITYNPNALFSPSSQVIEFSETVNLSPLNHPEISGYLAVQIFDYLIEFRLGDGWDDGIPKPTFLIHKGSGDLSTLILFDDTNNIQDWQPSAVFLPETNQSANTLPSRQDNPNGLFVVMKAISMPSWTGMIEIIFRCTPTFMLLPLPEKGFVKLFGVGSGGGGWGILPSGEVVNILPRLPESAIDLYIPSTKEKKT